MSNSSTINDTDPVFLAIEQHRQARQAVEEAGKALFDLEESLPADVRHGPRVRLGTIRRRDGGSTEMYARSLSDIDAHLERWSLCRSEHELNQRRSELYAAFEADAAALATTQVKTGLAAARERFDLACEAEDRAFHRVGQTTPSSVAGAAALARYVAAELARDEAWTDVMPGATALQGIGSALAQAS